MVKLWLFALLVLLSLPAQAATLLLTEPDQMECKRNSNPGYDSCDIHYDGGIIYEGPSRSPDKAGADCIKCKSVKAAAKKRAMNIIVDRDLGWDDDYFLTLTFDDMPAPVCQ